MLLIIGLMIDVCIRYVPTPENYINQFFRSFFVSVLTVGLGGGIYLVANLGPGPRDGLMIGLQKKTNLPIALVRATLEITVMYWLVFRWYSWCWNFIICFWNWTLCSFKFIFSK